MNKRFAGKVAMITGAARGQGRSHAVRFAEEGADIIATDICGQIETVNYRMARPEDLEETVRMVENAGGRIVAQQADVRDLSAMQRVVERGIEQLGRIDYVLANAGILPGIGSTPSTVAAYNDALDVMLKGTHYTIEAALPFLLRHGGGGAIVITSSAIAQKSVLSPSIRSMNHGVAGYTAAKSGLIGLMHYYARALGTRNIRVNCVHPTAAATPMVDNEPMKHLFDEFPEVAAAAMNLLPAAGLIESIDVTEALVYLCGESGRFVTGIALPIDAGNLLL